MAWNPSCCTANYEERVEVIGAGCALRAGAAGTTGATGAVVGVGATGGAGTGVGTAPEPLDPGIDASGGNGGKPAKGSGVGAT